MTSNYNYPLVGNNLLWYTSH